MFTKILIANRGEIACRIARTARRLGIATVAVYSDADAQALHVASCDAAVRIGAAPAAASYLNAAAIIAAARGAGVQAVHPGYGFLSENAEFAAACAAAGLVFIGPPVEAIRTMGSKVAARALMERCGVPLVPGYHGAGGGTAAADSTTEAEDAVLAREAARIGYPVLIKASAGGGGKGMRRVAAPADFAAALATCRREARASFGDDRMLLERCIERPRHVEIQIFADRHGHCIGLHERDCSVQRRHQKVLEEAPAPGLAPALRARMVAAGVAAARAVGYVGAGTVEFILDSEGRFYFIEMNTRLQVEHPVTEMITGLDLVEWQLRVAAGEPLPLTQEQVPLDGHAIEARIYAEDPARDFLPVAGRLDYLDVPETSRELRIDTGVREGDEITTWYDPMIAKLIVWDRDRPRAVARLEHALRAWRIAGIASNIDYLARLVACPAYRRGEIDTGLIERERGLLDAADMEPPPAAWTVAALALWQVHAAATHATAQAGGDPHSPWNATGGWRLNAPAKQVMWLRHGASERRVDLAGAAADQLGHGHLRVTLDGRVIRCAAHVGAGTVDVFLDGAHHGFMRGDLARGGGAGTAGGHTGLTSPMPGRIVAVHVQAGAVVERGAPLVVLEAMKMEHTISAPAAGIVLGVECAIGDQVREGVQLVNFQANTPGRGA
ncbi:MAG: ATP-grasp domain-containing protein [Gammaproteobacteria bacterium]|nr:ATP-grasp domain-containing protein [Gammaproteobacteria bacterium]